MLISSMFMSLINNKDIGDINCSVLVKIVSAYIFISERTDNYMQHTG